MEHHDRKMLLYIVLVIMALGIFSGEAMLNTRPSNFGTAVFKPTTTASSSSSISTSTSTSIQTSSSSSVLVTIDPLANTPYNFLNLTGAGIVNRTTQKLDTFIVVNNVTNVSITMDKAEVRVEQPILLNVTFRGQVYFNGSPPALYYILGKPYLINVHYFGVEYANESGNLTVQSNGPWNYFFNAPQKESRTYTPTSNSFRITWNVSINPNVTGKKLKFCGGFFAAYQNSSWAYDYDLLAREQVKVVNGSIINIPGQCTYLQVD
jgi:hypothetical protein